MSLSAQPMKYMFACTAQSDGIGTTTQKTNSQYAADRIKASGAKRAWIYFNNDNDAHAPQNATALRRMLGRLLSSKKVGTLPVSEAFSVVSENVR
jgi:hypothetical protein